MEKKRKQDKKPLTSVLENGFVQGAPRGVRVRLRRHCLKTRDIRRGKLVLYGAFDNKGFVPIVGRPSRIFLSCDVGDARVVVLAAIAWTSALR